MPHTRMINKYYHNMKRILLSLVVFACTLCAMATDAVTAKVSGTSLNIALTNELDYVAFQMDIQLPSGTTATDFAAVSARLSQEGDDQAIGGTKFIVASNLIDVENNIYRVVAYNLANAVISGTSGQDILKVTLGGTAVAQPSDIKLTKIIFVSKSDLELAKNVFEDTVGENGYIVGDVNCDTFVNSLDLTRLVNIILKKSEETPNSDVNGDRDINSLDLTRLLNIILKKV